MEVSQNEAISEGVKVWVVAFFGDFCASRGAGGFAARSAVDKSGNYPFFPLHETAPQRKICGGVDKEEGFAQRQV